MRADNGLRCAGKPGAGKGTLSARLTNKYEIISLSTGDLLRQHIAEKYVFFLRCASALLQCSTACASSRTQVGLLAEEIVASGGLLPDDVMLKVLTSKLDALHNKVCTHTTIAQSALVMLIGITCSTGYWMASRVPSARGNFLTNTSRESRQHTCSRVGFSHPHTLM